MAGFLCIFLDSCNSIPSTPYHHFPSKPFPSLTPIHLPHYPFISTPIISRKRRRRTSSESHQISALSQKFHLIQTTVHHDGSIIFQFGDPSEILKNDESVEDLAIEGEEDTHELKIVEGDHEKQVIVKTIENEDDVRCFNDVSHTVNGVDNGTAVIERAGDVEKDLGDSLVISSVSESMVDVLEGECEEGSNVAQVLHGRETKAESSEPDELVEDLESKGEEISNDVNVDEDHEIQELDKPIEIEETTDSDTSSSSDASASRNEDNNEITVVERENDVMDSQKESNHKSVEISRDEDVPIPLFVSASEIEIKDFDSSDIFLENPDDKEDCSDEDASTSSPVELDIASDGFSIERVEESEEVIAGVTKFESPSSKIEPNERYVKITAVDREKDLTDSQEESNERYAKISQDEEVALPLSVSVSEIKINESVVSHGLENTDDKEKCTDEKEEDASLRRVDVEEANFDTVGSFKDVVADEDPILLNQDFSNSLVGTEGTEVEEQINELSEVSIVEAIQLEIAETNGKREEISTTSFILSSGAAAVTHPSKALTGGEDAYFLTCNNWLGIADGISQWSLEGIDRGVYAHELMKNCEIIVSDNVSAPMLNPIDILSRSVEETQSSGSSTALIAYFDGQALHVANLGDTGFIIIRHGAVYKKSSPMFHEFNFPIHIQRGDNPSQFSKEYIIDLDEEDTIITATDGLFDNLYDLEIASIVSKSLQAAMKPEEIAQVLATRAQEGGKSGRGRSPFADAAKAAGYIGFSGGKLDDVTVIVSLVKKRSESSYI